MADAVAKQHADQARYTQSRNGALHDRKGKTRMEHDPKFGPIGERRAYIKGCRCDACRKAHTDYARERRHGLRPTQSLKGDWANQESWKDSDSDNSLTVSDEQCPKCDGETFTSPRSTLIFCRTCDLRFTPLAVRDKTELHEYREEKSRTVAVTPEREMNNRIAFGAKKLEFKRNVAEWIKGLNTDETKFNRSQRNQAAKFTDWLEAIRDEISGTDEKMWNTLIGEFNKIAEQIKGSGLIDKIAAVRKRQRDDEYENDDTYDDAIDGEIINDDTRALTASLAKRRDMAIREIGEALNHLPNIKQMADGTYYTNLVGSYKEAVIGRIDEAASLCRELNHSTDPDYLTDLINNKTPALIRGIYRTSETVSRQIQANQIMQPVTINNEYWRDREYT